MVRMLLMAVLLFSSAFLSAQVQIEAHVDQNSATAGSPITVLVYVSYPRDKDMSTATFMMEGEKIELNYLQSSTQSSLSIIN